MNHQAESYLQTVEEVSNLLKTDLSAGLSSEEASVRLSSSGPNEIREKPRRSPIQKLLEQFTDFLILTLVAAGILSALLGEWIDALVILSVVVINAVLGIVQEGRAEKAIDALRKMAAPNARVLRDGQVTLLPAASLVPGDVVLIEAGDIVPSDLRLAESVSLQIEEASLTGESVPAHKDASAVFHDALPLGDRVNTAYMGTAVTYGRGKGIVVATGAGTEIGSIAERLGAMKEEPTPLQQNLSRLGRWLGIVCIAVCAVVLVQGVLAGGEWLVMLMTAVSLAVAAIPEGLPAVVTIVLALGMRRMADRNAIVKRLPAVETLGGVDVICSDKTGTLTQNEMTVVLLHAGGQTAEVTGSGYSTEGEILVTGCTEGEGCLTAPLRRLLEIAALCNDARLVPESDHGNSIIGDPTEAAMLVAARKAGLDAKDLAVRFPRVGDLPFDSDRKRMTTFHSGFDEAPVLALVKGAPDLVVARCDFSLDLSGVNPLDEEGRNQLLKVVATMATSALRVLAFACRTYDTKPADDPESVEAKLTFVGLMGMIDPARPEAKEAVKVCAGAGIRVVMITGDHRETAVAIARNLGILDSTAGVLNGSELDAISDDELRRLSEVTGVYARVSPDHKVRIIEALQSNGHTVSMTGDGVNDAMALKRADIGVAMGITGTDVAKGTADMILTDDNFATIVHSVEEGRIIYSNIRKFVGFLLSCNIGEILVIFITVLLLGPRFAPLAPLQLLWLNLLTDSFPALALGKEKGEPDNMRRPPRQRQQPILDKAMGLTILIQASAIFASVFTAFQIGRIHYPDVLTDGVIHPDDGARTVAFATLVCAELFRAYSARSERSPVFSIGLFGNKSMLQATLVSAILLMAILYIPFLHPIFSTLALSLRDWRVILPLSLIPFAAGELQKIVQKALKTVFRRMR